MDKFTEAYIECALWSSMDNRPNEPIEPLDKNFTVNALTAETRKKMIHDCVEFQLRAGDLIRDSNVSHHAGLPASVETRAGHDFWLTRNGHGAGFWDGDWLEPAASELTAIADSFGCCDLSIGDDCRLYLS